MTTWKDGGDCGRMYREIVNEDESHIIAEVRIRRSAPYGGTIHSVRPWPEGERNFALILAAPQVLEALEAIRDMARQLKKITYRITREDWETVEGYARDAIAAAKGENDDR